MTILVGGTGTKLPAALVCQALGGLPRWNALASCTVRQVVSRERASSCPVGSLDIPDERNAAHLTRRGYWAGVDCAVIVAPCVNADALAKLWLMLGRANQPQTVTMPYGSASTDQAASTVARGAAALAAGMDDEDCRHVWLSRPGRWECPMGSRYYWL